jgi:hypothetical protein
MPANGGTLLAVAMAVGGWEGAPAFSGLPKEWLQAVKAEGFVSYV